MGQPDPTGENIAETDQAVLLELHGRLLAGDRLASEELAQRVLTPVLRRLEHRWPRWRHTDVLYDAAVDAFLDHADAPERYDPSRGSLLGWLEMAAHRDVTNVYQSGKQRRLHDTRPLSALTPMTGAEVTGDLPAGDASPVGLSRIGPDPDDADRLDRREVWGRIRDAFPDDRQREFIWACFVEGERSSQRLAEILGCAGLPEAQCRRKVKNTRDVALRKLRKMGLAE